VIAMPGDVLTAQEAAEFLHVAIGTVKRKAASGELPASKIGNRWRFLRDDLEDWLRAGGSRYEAVVDEGILAVVRERMAAAEPAIPLAEAKRRLGL
jgi:excisionase family DNA binding protein